MKNNPAIRKNSGRNIDGTFMKGVSGNPTGRPKSTLKDYLRQKFNNMSDEDKEIFLKGISPEVQFKMAEGNPAQGIDHTTNGESINTYDEEQLEAIARRIVSDGKTESTEIPN